MPIESLRDRDAERLFAGYSVRRYQAFASQATRRLNLLHQAGSLNELTRFPGSRLERLRGDRRGQYSIRINRQWRICFQWVNGSAYDVEIVDYH